MCQSSLLIGTRRLFGRRLDLLGSLRAMLAFSLVKLSRGYAS